MRLPLAVEEFLPRPTGNYPDCLRTFHSPFRLKFQAVLSRYALSQNGYGWGWLPSAERLQGSAHASRDAADRSKLMH